MKVLIALVVAIGSAAALGSGPYLPSGWRPEGPAFYLPSEDQQKPEEPANEGLQESEGSSSNFLREYGPPKVEEVSQDIKVQNLPEAVTEQPFVILDAKFGQEKIAAFEAATEAITELRSEVVEEVVTATEAIADESTTEVIQETVQEVVEEGIQEEVTEEIQGKSLNVEIEASEDTADSDNAASDAVSVNEENESVTAKLETEVEEQVTPVVEGVRNIAEAIVNLEKEAAAGQVKISQDITELKAVEQSPGSVQQVPEGFLEYGPPGFREYGPPKQNSILRTAAEETEEEQKVENNEARRRRFSPKFRSAKKH